MLKSLLTQLARRARQPAVDQKAERNASKAVGLPVGASGATPSRSAAHGQPQELPTEPVEPPKILGQGLVYVDDVTLLLPTVAHRVEFLRSTLQHLDFAMSRVRIVVSDHTEGGEIDAVLRTVAKHPNLRVTLLRHPGSMHFLQRLSACAKVAETPYVVVHADDDFMVPAALDDAVAFLHRHPDHVCCQGRTFFLKLRAPRSCAPKINLSLTRAEGDAGRRITSQCTNFTPTLYALTRRGAFIEANEAALSYTTNVVFWQYLSSCLLLAQGKSHVLDSLYYLRLDNPDGWRASLIRSGDKTHWPNLVVAPEFSHEMAGFRRGLIGALDRAGLTEASRVADDCCIALVRRAFNPVWPYDDAELELLSRASAPDSSEHQLVRYCGSLSLAALTRHHRDDSLRLS